MKTLRCLRSCLVPALLAANGALGVGAQASPTDLPHLAKQGRATQLIVDGKPFLIRGGELGNSSGEPEYLRPYWARFRSMHLNAVVAPVYWNLIEPAEGHFDFSTVDGMLTDARAHRMKLVLLWFGSWKNSMSCYVPAWIKRDSARFPRCVDSRGSPQEILSPFAAANRDADANVFAGLMRHLREVDSRDHTVVIVQVENEIGNIPDARDHSDAANRSYADQVPLKLMHYLAANRESLIPEFRTLWLAAGGKPGGTWAEVFGGTVAGEEVFTAWQFAVYAQAVAAAGKAEYPLPMYANAALIRPGHKPGQYPSGGPLPHLLDVWRAAGDSLDMFSPDIYFPNFVEWCRRYVRSGNPLFIPEALRSVDATANGLYAFGSCDAIGFSPFGIETIGEPAASLLTSGYDLIEQLTPLIAEHQGRGTMLGLIKESPDETAPQQVRLGGFVLNATFEYGPGPSLADGVTYLGGAGLPTAAPTLPAAAIVIATGPDEFLFAGMGVTVTFARPDSRDGVAGIQSVEEGRFVEGAWEHVRWLNGDQTHQGRHMRLEPGRFCIQRVRLYAYR